MDNNKLFSKTFLWMFIGLLLTFLTGFYVANNEVMFTNIFKGYWFVGLIILELVLVIFLSARVFKMKPSTAKCCFILYSIISGLTFSSIFIYYELSSIIYIFLLTALVFGVLALIGYTTKTDMTKVGKYCIIGLIGAIIVVIINIFLQNTIIDLIVSIVILLLFVGITIYDVQKLKNLQNSDLPVENLAIYGALDLYLDFINIFIELLRLFARER